MRHGVSRQDAAQILQSVGGNLEMAETLILQQKFNFPEF